jgi:hypothetical protein
MIDSCFQKKGSLTKRALFSHEALTIYQNEDKACAKHLTERARVASSVDSLQDARRLARAKKHAVNTLDVIV